MAQYLFRRIGQYYFRLRIPAAYRHHYGGKQEIRRTLGTHNRQVAIAVSAGILAELKKRFTHKDIDALQEEIRRAYLDPVLRWTKIQKGDVNIEIDYGDPEREKEAALALLSDIEGNAMFDF